MAMAAKNRVPKRILVTGGAGFIGSHLCEYLVERGDFVICLDNFFTGSRRNIEHLLDHPRFRLVEHDIAVPFDISGRLDEVYHLACPASPLHYQLDPVQTVTVNVFGTRHVLELARRIGARVLLASTSEVYGNPTEHPQRETYFGNVNPTSPRACYDEGKRCAETLCMDYHRQYGVAVRIVRIFNTYGPRMSLTDGRAIANFIIQALRGERFTVWGDGTQTRSFQYVADLVGGMVAMMEQDGFTGPVNVGNPSEYTVLELIDEIKKVTGAAGDVAFVRAMPDSDPVRRRPDISLAKEKLNWEPTVTLREGLQKTIPYFREQFGRPRRVLIFSVAYFPFVGGAEVAVKEITDRIPDWHFDLITVDLAGDLPQVEKVGNVTVHRLRMGGLAKVLKGSERGKRALKYLYPVFAFWKASRMHRERPYNAIHSIMANYAGFAALFFKWRYPQVPFLLTLQEGDPIDYIKRRVRLFVITPWLFRKIFQKANYVQSISKYLAKFAQSMGYRGPIEVIPNGVDVPHFTKAVGEAELRALRERLGIRPDERVVITTSRLVLKNGVDDLIKGVALAKQRTKLIICGVGQDETTLKILAQGLGVADRALFVGHVSHAELPKYLKISNTFCRPSLSEGLGNSFLEAMAAGLPIIGTPVGGIVDFLEDRKTGLLCRVRDPESIARAINLLLEDRGLRERITQAGRELIRENYDWVGIGERMQNIYERFS